MTNYWTAEPIHHYGTDLHYSAYVFSNKLVPGNRLYLPQPLPDFVSDAGHYRQYITKAMNEIEVCIEV